MVGGPDSKDEGPWGRGVLGLVSNLSLGGGMPAVPTCSAVHCAVPHTCHLAFTLKSTAQETQALGLKFCPLWH